jgi:heat shock protein HtpX
LIGLFIQNEIGHGVGYFITEVIAQIALGFLASLLVMWFSRYREFKADAGGAIMAGRDNMINIFRELKLVYESSAFGSAYYYIT